MQRSFSSSAADHQHHSCSSTATRRHLPVHLVSNHSNDYYSSDTNTQRQTYLQRASSSSSVSSTSSTGSCSYRILPVRYSSVDRVLQKPPKVTANERGINVRIHFDRPSLHRRHRHRDRRHHEQRTEEYEHSHQKHMSKEEHHYGSCPVLNETHGKSASSGPSNITYIETRSIVRDASTDQMNGNLHSNELIMRERTMPSSPTANRSPVTNMRIKHIPLEAPYLSTPVITRVIRKEEECSAEISRCNVIITNGFFSFSF